MVAKISSTANLGGALGYNFRKVAAGDAVVLLTSGLSLDREGNTSLERALEDMSLLMPVMMRTKKPVFHVSLNPHPDDRLDDGQLAEIAEYYMRQLGYGDQPYIVFKHSDIEREHIHIVSLRVDSDGHKIDDSFERRRSKRISNEIERMWKLHPSDRNAIVPADELKVADAGNGEIRKQIAAILSAVLKKYDFQSLGELNAILASYNIVAEEVKKESRGRKYNGMVYSVTGADGKKKTVPIDAGELGRGYGYNALRTRMADSEKRFAAHRAYLRRAVRKTMSGSPDRDAFVRQLEKNDISVVFRENESGRIYGITFIDERNGVAANGSRLGKGYSAAVFNDYFNGSGHNPFAGMAESRLAERPGQEERSDDMMAGIEDLLLDGTVPQGIDYKEMAFQKKMRKLHSGKIRRKK